MLFHGFVSNHTDYIEFADRCVWCELLAVVLWYHMFFFCLASCLLVCVFYFFISACRVFTQLSVASLVCVPASVFRRPCTSSLLDLSRKPLCALQSDLCIRERARRLGMEELQGIGVPYYCWYFVRGDLIARQIHGFGRLLLEVLSRFFVVTFFLYS